MIELQTLGALELTSTDRTAAESVLAQPRRAALFCYLALALPRGFHRRDTLFALFWPEEDADQARHALRQSLYFLRRALGAKTILSRGDEELALAPEQVRCDVWDFDAAIEQGRPADALALYRGDLLAGFHISAAPDFERWLDQERSRLRQRAGEAAWALAAARERAGDATGAAEAARQAATFSPTDETALRRLILLLERVGDRAAAVRAYEAFAWRLQGEYELEPSAETQAVVTRIRAEPKASQAVAPDHQSGVSPPSTGSPVGAAVALPADATSIAPARLRRSRAAWKPIGVLMASLAVLVAAGWAIGNQLRPETLEIRRLAVLPLANLTGDERQEYFVDGMHEALVTELSQIPDLTVISRQSTVQYQGTDRPVPVIARELGVDALLEGSVFRAEDSVRITVQLIRAKPEQHVWAGTYHGALRDGIALQGEVARAVGRAIHARGAPEPHARLAAPSVIPEAQEAYLQGLYHLERQMVTELTRSGRLETLRTAVANLETAVALAPEWAAAHAKLARADHWIASSYDELAPEFYSKSKTAALRALELDPNEAQAHASLGFVLFNHEWDWERAERSIQRALTLDPNSHQWIYAMFLVAVGRAEEATIHYRRAQERNPMSPILKSQLAWTYSCAGRPDEAIAEFEELRARMGNSPPDWLRAAFGEQYLAKSMYPEAIAALDSAVTVSDSNPGFVALLAHGYARAGRVGDAQRLARWLEQRPGRWYAPQLYTALGDTARAIAMIQSAFEQRSNNILYLRCATAYPALRNKPQIREIVRRMGLPE